MMAGRKQEGSPMVKPQKVDWLKLERELRELVADAIEGKIVNVDDLAWLVDDRLGFHTGRGYYSTELELEARLVSMYPVWDR